MATFELRFDGRSKISLLLLHTTDCRFYFGAARPFKDLPSRNDRLPRAHTTLALSHHGTPCAHLALRTTRLALLAVSWGVVCTLLVTLPTSTATLLLVAATTTALVVIVVTAAPALVVVIVVASLLLVSLAAVVVTVAAVTLALATALAFLPETAVVVQHGRAESLRVQFTLGVARRAGHVVARGDRVEETPARACVDWLNHRCPLILIHHLSLLIGHVHFSEGLFKVELRLLHHKASTLLPSGSHFQEVLSGTGERGGTVRLLAALVMLLLRLALLLLTLLRLALLLLALLRLGCAT